jgi:hypothetical protein
MLRLLEKVIDGVFENIYFFIVPPTLLVFAGLMLWGCIKSDEASVKLEENKPKTCSCCEQNRK